MKKILMLILCICLCGCGKAASGNAKFINDMSSFCTNISDIDAAINKITNISNDEAGLAAAKKELLNYLDMLDDEFKKLANIDFPAEFDSLESIADESSEYMTEAVRCYHIVYEDDYSESMEDYAKENYSRAYKRVQYIINYINSSN